MFLITRAPIDIPHFQGLLADPSCGALVGFEGRVRDNQDGRRVLSLEYEAYEALALAEGNRILESIKWKLGLRQILGVHRVGHLRIGEAAVWVGAISEHRQEAFEGVMRAMREIKTTVPIWKREYYADGEPAWVLCHEGGHSHAGGHSHDSTDKVACQPGATSGLPGGIPPIVQRPGDISHGLGFAREARTP